jgi:hypothetical protein
MSVSTAFSKENTNKEYVMVSKRKPPLPQQFSFRGSTAIIKLEGGVYYALQQIGEVWYYSVGTHQPTRPLSIVEQAHLNMIAEHYERRIQAYRKRLEEAGLDPDLDLDPINI